jgi:hypothetical protein
VIDERHGRQEFRFEFVFGPVEFRFRFTSRELDHGRQRFRRNVGCDSGYRCKRQRRERQRGERQHRRK